MRTKVFWEMTNHCTAGCSYCPAKFWGGEKPRTYGDYYTAGKTIIDHYASLGRYIDWTFTGGELLEIIDFPLILKLCKENNGTTEITTNGGTQWLDWWVIEPYVDDLHLTYHYWQNPNLIKFILQTFSKKNKSCRVTIPIRHNGFEEDLSRADTIEQEHGLTVTRSILYQEADSSIGMLGYSESQLERLFGVEWVDLNVRKKIKLTHKEEFQQLLNINPSYTGKLCNVGIEFLRINNAGWVSGSFCNTAHLGNLWNGTLQLPNGPQPCKMLSCINLEDQKITKFN